MFSEEAANSKLFLIVGLGNPDQKYSKTRHNIGFMFADEIADCFDFSPFSFSNKLNGLVALGEIEGKKSIILKPSTYMNNSGFAVSRAVGYYKIDRANIMVAHDDMDISFGSQRIRKGGSSAGHNGIKSIIAELGDPNFTRIRLGIGRPQLPIPIADYVLMNFSQDQQTTLEEIRKGWHLIVSEIIKNGVEAAMNTFNCKNS